MEQFDPYRRWLGIPEGSRPPTHYQLLGISPDEQDHDVIDAAVIRQSAYVRNFQAGKHAEQAARILNEIAAAKACLQDPAKRARYDAELKRKLGAASPAIRTALPGGQPARSTPLPGQAAPLGGLARLAPAPADVPLPPPRPISRLPRRQPRTLRPPRRHAPPAWQIACAAVVVLALSALALLVILRAGDSRRPGANETAEASGQAAARPAELPAGGPASADNTRAGSSGPAAAPAGRPTVLNAPEPIRPEPEATGRAERPEPPPEGPRTKRAPTNDEPEPPAEAEQPEPPPGGFALRFAGNGYVELADSRHMLDLNGNYTIEMWVRWLISPGAQYLAGDEAWRGMHRQVRVDRAAAGWVLRTRSQAGRLVFDFSVAGARDWISVLSDPVPVTTDWQHVAVSKVGGTIRLFHNGRLVGSRPGTDHYIPSPTPTYVGPRRFAFANRRFDGFVRGFRVSRMARYSGEFKPAAEFVDDEATLVLLDFSAGEGRELADLSGNRRHGIISGPVWAEISKPGR